MEAIAESRAADGYSYDEALADLEAVTAERDALRQGCEAVLLFHSAGHWDTQMKLRWDNLTRHADATTKGLCGVIRKALGME